MDVLEKAQELERMGKHIIHMEVGEPDFDTPECISEACYRAICEGKTHYTHSLGLIELRGAISEDYWEKYRVKVSPEKIEEKLNPRVKGIIINSPSNPTGNIMDAKRMKEIAKLSPFIISDEIY